MHGRVHPREVKVPHGRHGLERPGMKCTNSCLTNHDTMRPTGSSHLNLYVLDISQESSWSGRWRPAAQRWRPSQHHNIYRYTVVKYISKMIGKMLLLKVPHTLGWPTHATIMVIKSSVQHHLSPLLPASAQPLSSLLRMTL